MKKRIRSASTSDLTLLNKSSSVKEECEYKLNSLSAPNLNIRISRLQKRVNMKIVKRWKRQYYAQLTPDQLEEYKKKKKLNEYDKNVRYGQYLMILLAVVSIPMDFWKLYEGVQKTERAIDGPTPFEVLEFYASTLTTHFVGIAGAIDKDITITLLCRFVSTIVYQSGLTKGNSSIPTDPKELHKYIKDHVPKHRLPPGYKPIDPDTIQSTSMHDDYAGPMGSRMPKRSKSSKSKKSSSSSSSKNKKRSESKAKPKKNIKSSRTTGKKRSNTKN